MADPTFLFTTCQITAERALKAETARLWPDLRLAFSRPGFVTWKLPTRHGLSDDFHPHLVFARSHGFSLGKVTGETDAARVEAARQLVGAINFDELHVVIRGETPSEQVPSAVAVLGEALGWQPLALREAAVAARVTRPKTSAARSPLVLDCILVEPCLWWLGFHRVTEIATSWPGGWHLAPLPEHAVSRAYLKMDEALAWSQIPVAPGEQVAEIGCSPGGASQALLDRGLIVLGIDPAQVDQRVIAHPHFTHLRKRGHEVRRREFRKTRWLTADMNVAPQYTLDTVEAIVSHPEVNVRGMLLTLKLLEWSLAGQIPACLERIRSWGYADVQARQLSHNRQEICVAARLHATARPDG